jgi:hypothetical protein
VRTPAGLAWVTCDREADYMTSRHRHLADAGAPTAAWSTTLCGSTGQEGSWKFNKRKPRCPACVQAATPARLARKN